MKKVLMIAYAFPPMGGSAVQRTLKFAKYLPQFGWEPVILTVNKPAKEEYDPSFLEELHKGIRIYRTPCPELSGLFMYIRKRFFGNVDSMENYNKDSTRIASTLKRHLAYYANSFVKTWLSIPDDKIGWLPFALVKALDVIRKERIDVIYSTSNPYTDHLIWYVLKKIAGKPGVVDFRDPWTQWAYYYHDLNYSHSRTRLLLDEYFERNILRLADKVISATEPISEGLASRCNFIDKTKFVTITNGFDPDDFKGVGDVKTLDKFTIVYTGSLRGLRTLRPFLVALRELLNEHEALKTDISVIIIGYIGVGYEYLINELGLVDIVQLRGYMGHKECIRYLLSASVLLMILSGNEQEKVILPAKLFEYMASRKPILTLAPDGILSEWIKSMELGIVTGPEDINGIKSGIWTLYQRYKQNNLNVTDNHIISQFERPALTKKLAGILDEVLEQYNGNKRGRL